MDQNGILFLVGRDNWRKNNSMNNMVLQDMKKMGFKVHWEDAAGNWIYRLWQWEARFARIPKWVKHLQVRLTQLIFAITHWSYFAYLIHRRKSPKFRSGYLKKAMQRLAAEKEIVVLSYSSGARVSSQVADSAKVKRLICIGYPFQHPREDADPDRYEHLSRLKTPMLIIQGKNDEYGGAEMIGQYELSPSIEVFWVDSTHDYRLSYPEWKKAFEKIQAFIGRELDVSVPRES